MNKLLPLLLLVLITNITHAQNNVGIGTNSPDPKAALDITATDKGVLVPRLNTSQILGITTPTPPNGLLVYNTDSAAFAYRITGAWVYLKGNITSSNDWSTKGNAGTDAAVNFIGTTDDKDVILKRNNVRAGLLGTTNTSWGKGALLKQVNTGVGNTGIGSIALTNNTTGGNNTATGYAALFTNINGSGNTANGWSSLYLNVLGSYNTATGLASLNSNTSGNDNVANGYSAMISNTTGFSNVAIGSSALYSNTTISNLVAIGDSALYNNGIGATQFYHSVYNTAVGSKALYANTTGGQNTAIGIHTLMSNSTGSNNTAVGSEVLYANTSGSLNTAIGNKTLSTNTTGDRNIAMGYGAMQFSKTATGNVAIGTVALNNNTIKKGNVAIGDSALYNSGPGTPDIFEAEDNTAVGNRSMVTNTTGFRNAAFGNLSLLQNTTGNFNTAIGDRSMYANQSGNSNTAVGQGALGKLESGIFNVALGGGALGQNISGLSNIGIGQQAGWLNTGNNNVFLGGGTGYYNTGGSNNVFIGTSAGYNETGSNKLYIANNDADANNALLYGEFDNKSLQLNGKLTVKTTAGNTGLDLATSDAYAELRQIRNTTKTRTGSGDNDLYFGFMSSAPSSIHLYSDASETMTIKGNKVLIGTSTAASKLTLDGGFGDAFTILNGGDTRIWNDAATGNSSFYVSTGTGTDAGVFTIKSDNKIFSFNGTGGSVSSDSRMKKDIVPLEGSLEKILQLNGYSYRFKTKAGNTPKEIGVIAQEVKKVLPEAVFTNDDGTYAVSYNSLVPLLINGVKEQQKIIQTQEQRIATLEEKQKTIDDQEKRIATLEAMLKNSQKVNN